LPKARPTAAPKTKAAEAPRLSEIMQATWEKLPTREQMAKKTSEEVHFTPPEVLAIAEDLGHIADELKAKPELIPSGVEFFRGCAGRENVLEAVRAVCLKELQRWAPQAQPPIAVELAAYPANIRRIADGLLGKR
jgi:hypothetical protein